MQTPHSEEDKIKKFVFELNEFLKPSGNFVLTFQFLSVDKTDGSQMVWHLFSQTFREYNLASLDFIYAPKQNDLNRKCPLQRTMFTSEYEENSYWFKNLGPLPVLKKSRPGNYEYKSHLLEDDVTDDFINYPPPNSTDSSLGSLLEFWEKCLKNHFGDRGSIIWVTQKHRVKDLGKVISHGLCMFNTGISDEVLRYKISKRIRDFIIDHNLGLYIKPKENKIEELTEKIKLLTDDEERFLHELDEENPDIYLCEDLRKQLFKYRRAIESDLPILLYGETGTGKDIIADVIHKLSKRKGAYLTVNGASFLEDDPLAKSEIFGHEAGAFTDAKNLKKGYVEQCDHGTLFFDEIQQTPVKVQMQLKRLIEEKKFRRIAGNKDQTSDVRFVFATNEKMTDLIKSKRILEDFYYRINVVDISLPSIREQMPRFDEIVNYFCKKISKVFGKKDISAQAMAKLRAYPYPGNFRELENILKRAYVLSESILIEEQHLRFDTDSASLTETIVDPLPSLKFDNDRFDRQVLTLIQQCAAAALSITQERGKLTRASIHSKAKEMFQTYSYATPQSITQCLQTNSKKEFILELILKNGEALELLVNSNKFFPKSIMEELHKRKLN